MSVFSDTRLIGEAVSWCLGAGEWRSGLTQWSNGSELGRVRIGRIWRGGGLIDKR